MGHIYNTQVTLEVIEKWFDNNHYDINITFSERDKCYRATIKEYPDLVDYSNTKEHALILLKDSVLSTAEYLLSKNKSIPTPLERKHHIHDYFQNNQFNHIKINTNTKYETH